MQVQVEVFVTALVDSVGDEDLRLGEVDDADDGLPLQSEHLPDGPGVQLDGGGQVSQDDVERLGVAVVEQDADRLCKSRLVKPRQ